MIALSLFSSDASDPDAESASSETVRQTSVVSEGATIDGILDLSSVDLRIEGVVQGDISTDGGVVVAEGAEVRGTIDARSVRLAGFMKGHVRAAESLVLCPPSKVRATLEAGVLEIQPGADFSGEVPRDPSAAEPPAPLDSTDRLTIPRPSRDADPERANGEADVDA